MTDLYIGTKIIMAQAMNRQEYNDYRGWVLPSDEDGSDEGYLVEYTDGGTPNHHAHSGYISWSPKAQFDAAYLLIGDVSGLPAYAQRLHGERAELYARSLKLERHMATPLFASLPGPEQERQRRQAVLMRQLLEVLTARIDAL